MMLRRKTIIITGASSGIGAAAAVLFAKEGANVVLGARRTDLLKGLCDRIGALGGAATFVAGDIRDEVFSKQLVDDAVNHFGALDGAFNNAGAIGELGPIGDMREDNWRQVIDTNLTGAFFNAKHQIPAMIKNNGGAIVFTSSFVGYSNGGMPGMAAYAASKAGLIGLSKALASDHGSDGVRVNALLPGGTKTDMAPQDPEVQEHIKQFHALKRMADPEEIAQSAMFLLSDNAQFITGSAMLCDGGVSVQL